MSQFYDVVAMGSATQDVFAQTDAETITIRHANHSHETESLIAYPLGTKILIENLEFEIGGGGTNTATTFARQGLKTGFIGKIGKDPSGYAVFQFLKEENITFLGSTGEQTGYSVILDSEEDDRTILTFKGSNSQLTFDEIEKRVSSLETRWLYCSSMIGKSFPTMREVMRVLKSRGARVAFNPSCYQAEMGLDKLREVLTHVDILILNKEEARVLTDSKNDAAELARTIRGAGPTTVIITDGAAGSTLYEEGRSIHTAPASGLQVIETTGAGDAFASGFISGLAHGFDAPRAMLYGMVNAERVISEYGAKNHILTKEESEKALENDTRHVEVTQ